MQLYLLAVGAHMPVWVETGYQTYAKRLTRECKLALVEIPSAKQSRSDTVATIQRREETALLQAIPAQSHVVALDVKGEAWDTPTLAKQLQNWQMQHKSVSLLIGGTEGLSPNCLQRASQCWSLSPLTFPHPLVRVIVAEQLYRAWSLLKGHPYHRG